MQIKTDRATQPPGHRLHLRHNHHLPHAVDKNGRRNGTTTQTDTCSQHNPGESQGRPPKSTGSQPIVQNGLPSASSQEDPCPGSPDRTRGAGQSLHGKIFMPRYPQLKTERDHGSAAPPAQARVDNDRAGSRRHCRSHANAVVKILAPAWDDQHERRLLASRRLHRRADAEALPGVASADTSLPRRREPRSTEWATCIAPKESLLPRQPKAVMSSARQRPHGSPIAGLRERARNPSSCLGSSDASVAHMATSRSIAPLCAQTSLPDDTGIVVPKWALPDRADSSLAESAASATEGLSPREAAGSA